MEPKAIMEIAKLLREVRGDADAMSYASAQAIECHLTGDEPGRARWQAILCELRFTCRPPATSNLDIYRAAYILLGTHGEEGALEELERRSQTITGMHAGIYPRLRDAVVELARRERNGETVQ